MRIFVVKKSTLIRTAVFIILLAAAIIYSQVFVSESAPAFNENGKAVPVCSVAMENKAVAITIDTAFGDDYTDDILKVLDEKKVKATFFILGLWAEKNPALAESIAKAGHEIANHSYAHTRYTDMMATEIKDDVTKANEAIKKATGMESNLVRPPYGAFDDESILALKEESCIPIKWSVDSKDWKQPGKAAIVSNVLDNVKPGSIIIFQNNTADTPSALGETIDELKARGYNIVILSDLLLKDGYFVDESGVQKPFTE